jgi:hypothetical protein
MQKERQMITPLVKRHGRSFLVRQVMMLLLSLKLTAPHRLVLLRGAQETRAATQELGFKVGSRTLACGV